MTEQQISDVSDQIAEQVTLEDRKYVSFFTEDKYYPAVEDKVMIIPFLGKTREIIKVFDVFGVIFSPVKNDMEKNVNKLQKVYDDNQGRFLTLNDMLDFEIETKDKNKYATVSGVWLGRGLEFMYEFFLTLVEEHNEDNLPEEKLTKNMQMAYQKTLNTFHNIFSRTLFNTLCHAAPKRTDLYTALLIGLSEAEKKAMSKVEIHKTIIADVKPYLKTLKENIDAWKQAFTDRKLQNTK